jgi:hypothetical protein
MWSTTPSWPPSSMDSRVVGSSAEFVSAQRRGCGTPRCRRAPGSSRAWSQPTGTGVLRRLMGAAPRVGAGGLRELVVRSRRSLPAKAEWALVDGCGGGTATARGRACSAAPTTTGFAPSAPTAAAAGSCTSSAATRIVVVRGTILSDPVSPRRPATRPSWSELQAGAGRAKSLAPAGRALATATGGPTVLPGPVST